MEWSVKLFLQVSILLPVIYLIYRFWLLPSGRIRANRWFLLLTYPFVFGLLVSNLQLPVMDVGNFFMANEVAMPDARPAVSETKTIELPDSVDGSPGVTNITPATERKRFLGEQATFMLGWSYLLVFGILFLQRTLGWVKLRILLGRAVPLSEGDYNLPSKPGGLPDISFPVKAYCLPKSQNLAFAHWHCYFVSPNLLNVPETPAILAHEATHAGQLHSLDLMISEIFTLLFWFHPVAWLLRRELRLNLEYLADRKACAHSADRKSYLRALVAQSLNEANIPALNFHHSPLKNRIEMLRQSPTSITRYFCFLGLGIFLAIGLAACTESLLPEEETTVTNGKENLHEFYLTGEPTTREWYELRSALNALNADLRMIIRGPGNELHGFEIVIGEGGEDLTLEGLLKNDSPIKITVDPTEKTVQANYFYDELPVNDQSGNILSFRNGQAYKLPIENLARSMVFSDLSERQQHWKTFHGSNPLADAVAHVTANLPDAEIVYEYNNHKITGPPTDLNTPIDHVTVRTTVGYAPKARISIHTRPARNFTDDTNYGDLAANTLKLVEPHPELGVKYAVSLKDEADPLAVLQDQLKVIYPNEEIHYYIQGKKLSENDFYNRFAELLFYCVAKSYLEGEPVVVNGEIPG